MELTKAQGVHWAAVTRRSYRSGTLSPEIIAECESIRWWSWEQQQIGPTKRTFLPFAKGRAFVRKLHLQGREWRTYCKSGAKPADIPSHLEVDITDLELGHSIRVSEIAIPAGVTVELDPETAVVIGIAPRGSGGTGEEIEEEAAAEPAAEEANS